MSVNPAIMLRLTHPPSLPNNLFRLGAATSQRREALMENTQEDLKAHLMATDDEFRKLAEEHSRYHRQLEALDAKTLLTDQEQVEEQRLKKLKLRLKDQMNAMMSRYKAQHVA
jgi:uncharacterized protein